MKFRLTHLLLSVVLFGSLPLLAQPEKPGAVANKAAKVAPKKAAKAAPKKAQQAAKIPQEYRILSIPGDWNCPSPGELTAKMITALTGSKDTKVVWERRLNGDAGETSDLHHGKPVVYLEAKGKVFVRKTSEEVDGFKLKATVFPGNDGVYLLQCHLHQSKYLEHRVVEALDLPVGKPLFSSRHVTANQAVRSGTWHLLYDQGKTSAGKERILMLARVGRTPKQPIKINIPKPLDIKSLTAHHDDESKTSRFTGNASVDLGLFKLHSEDLSLLRGLPLPSATPGQLPKEIGQQELSLIPLEWDRKSGILKAKSIKVKRGNAQLNAGEGFLQFGPQ